MFLNHEFNRYTATFIIYKFVISKSQMHAYIGSCPQQMQGMKLLLLYHKESV